MVLKILLIIAFVLFLKVCKKKDIEKPKPTVGFSYSFIQSGILPTDVQFTSKSENTESYFWDFVDSTTSSPQSPKHFYNAAKTYKLKLVVSNGVGKDSMTKGIAITLDKPKPDFTFTVQNNGFLPDTVDFVNTSTNALAVKWFFGDGDTVTTQGAVCNFFLASCATANENLMVIFQNWRWPLSANAVAEAKYP
jgi:PKD repeat protein